MKPNIDDTLRTQSALTFDATYVHSNRRICVTKQNCSLARHSTVRTASC